MYLVDTSVWVDYLRESESEGVRRFSDAVEQGVPFGLTGVIFQEVLQGAASETDLDTLSEYLGTQRFYHPQDPAESHGQAARLYFRCRRAGVTVRSTIDCLIAQVAIEHDLLLLHNDKDFEHMARVVEELTLA